MSASPGNSNLIAPAIWRDSTTLDALHLVQRDGSFIGKRDLKPVIAANPENDVVFALYCGCLLWTGERPMAMQLLVDRIEIKPTASLLATYGLSQWMENDKDTAEETLEEALALDPLDYLAIRHASDFATVKGDDVRFNELMQLAETHYSGDPWVYGKRITHHLSKGATQEVRRLLDSATPDFKSLSMFHHHWGMLFLHERNLEDMEKQYRYAVAMSPETAQYWGYLSMALRHMGRYDEAETAADHALDLDPTYRFALDTKIKIAERNGDKAAAKQLEARLASSMPGMDKSRIREASQQVREGNMKGAIGIYRKVLSDPNSDRFDRKTAENCLLDNYALQGDWVEMRALLNEMEQSGRIATSRHRAYLAEVDFQLGDMTGLDRLVMLQRSENAPSNVHLALIRAYCKLGDQKALAAFVTSLCNNLPADPIPLCHGLIALDQLGEQDMAFALYEAIRKKRPQLPALRYYELIDALKKGDISRARRLNRDLPPGERITAKSVLIAKARRLLGR